MSLSVLPRQSRDYRLPPLVLYPEGEETIRLHRSGTGEPWLATRFAGTLQENHEFFLGLNIKYVGLGRIKLSCETYINTLKGRFPTETMGKEGRDITIPSDKTLLESY